MTPPQLRRCPTCKAFLPDNAFIDDTSHSRKTCNTCRRYREKARARMRNPEYFGPRMLVDPDPLGIPPIPVEWQVTP